ncbi:MAG: hypothetical protein ABIE43_05765 [Patescibacteria group bacterium]
MILFISFLIGSVAPDIIFIPKLLLDKIKNKKPFVDQSKMFSLLCEIASSLPLWVLLTRILSYNFTLFILFLAGSTHLLIDILTHSEKKYKKTDPSYIWPIYPYLTNYKLNGAWEYRYDYGVLVPKPLESIIFFTTAMASLYLAIIKYY